MVENVGERVQDWLVDNVFDYPHDDEGKEIGRLEKRMLNDLSLEGISKEDLMDLNMDPHEVVQTYFFSVQEERR